MSWLQSNCAGQQGSSELTGSISVRAQGSDNAVVSLKISGAMATFFQLHLKDTRH